MATDRYNSPLSERYASKEMQYIFSPDMKFVHFLCPGFPKHPHNPAGCGSPHNGIVNHNHPPKCPRGCPSARGALPGIIPWNRLQEISGEILSGKNSRKK